MDAKTELPNAGEFLVSEGNNSISREKLTFEAGLTLSPGTVVAEVTATGRYKPVNPDAEDGSEVAAGVLFAGIMTGDTTGEGVVIARLAEVLDSLLVWPEGITEEAQSNALNELAGLDIIVRSE